ncbi:LADA_0G15874g1_1 [Lachancea dasiensis]|uniref:LADA_0G15874g1_1 n=1 Tax=Lachancea dasiensis TaxID=1072105 RepID=A0A1G4JWK9_9SACH|nr:LADA_0G15874g1_1 [Lachancea dasiensis]
MTRQVHSRAVRRSERSKRTHNSVCNLGWILSLSGTVDLPTHNVVQSVYERNNPHERLFISTRNGVSVCVSSGPQEGSLRTRGSRQATNNHQRATRIQKNTRVVEFTREPRFTPIDAELRGTPYSPPSPLPSYSSQHLQLGSPPPQYPQPPQYESPLEQQQEQHHPATKREAVFRWISDKLERHVGALGKMMLVCLRLEDVFLYLYLTQLSLVIIICALTKAAVEGLVDDGGITYVLDKIPDYLIDYTTFASHIP